MALPSLSIRAAKGLSQAAALSVVAAAGAILAGPSTAQAAPIAACGSASYSITQLTTGGFSCDIGDKTYSDFAFSGLTTGAYTFSVDPGTFDHIFAGSGLTYTGSGFTYQYKVSLNSTAPVGQAFKAYNTGFNDSSTSTTGTYKKVLNAYNATGTTQLTGGTLSGSVTPTAASVTAQTVLSPFKGVVSDGPYSFTGGEVGPIVFKNTVTRLTTGGRIDIITDSVTQLITPTTTTEAPAPLPILGAGAAFGLSRKLRRRIKLA
jgi:hypothetical protein